MTLRGPLLTAIATLFWLMGSAGSANGHIVHAQSTLLSLVGSSGLVAHVKILDPHATATLEATGKRRPVVRVELREVFKGEPKAGEELRFAPHGHGVAQYVVGQEVLIFLVPLARSKELAALEKTGVRWVSLQEHDSRYVLVGKSRDLVLKATRGYAASERVLDAETRIAALREITVELLTSDDVVLAGSAVRDLVAAGRIPLVTAADAPRLQTEVIDSVDAPIGVRVGLLAELERRGLVDAVPLWQALLQSTAKPELLQVVRAAGRHPSPEVNAALVGMLGRDDAVAEAAALALGAPVHAGVEPALAAALERDEVRVRMAVIRALGRIGTPAAKATLESVARTHPDPATQRRAAAEVRNPKLWR